MSSEAPPFERIALLDALGKSKGFLIPVFRHGQSNSLFVQHVQNGTIIGFDALDLSDLKLLPCKPLETKPGEPECWAFGFGDGDVVLGQGNVGRDLLLEGLRDPRLLESPGLGFELAEFLGCPTERMAFAKSVKEKLGSVSRTAASAWCDLSVLTPDLRRRLRAGSVDAMVVGAEKLVATTEWKSVIIRGAPLGVDGNRQIIVHAIDRLMEELLPLYGRPAPGWEVEFREVRDRRSFQPAPDLVAMNGSPKLDYVVEALERDPLLRVATFDRHRPAEFLRAQSKSKRPGFIFYDISDPGSLSEVVNRSDYGIVAIEMQSHLTSASVRRSSDLTVGSMPVVACQASPAIRGRAGFNSELRRLQLAMAGAATVLEQSDAEPLPRRSFLLHGRSQERESSSDAWFALYDRAWSLGLNPHDGYWIGPRFELRMQGPPVGEELVDCLFPVSERLESELSNRVLEAIKSDGILIVPAGTPSASAYNKRKNALVRILDYQGWSVEETGRTNSELIIAGRGVRYLISTHDQQGQSSPGIGIYRELRLAEVERLIISSMATPGAVVARFTETGELELNVRDLLCFPADRSTVYTVLGSQLMRMMTGFHSRTRSDFLALLVADAIHRGDVNLKEGNVLRSAMDSGTLGIQAVLDLRRVRRERGLVIADVQVSATERNEYARRGTPLVGRFAMVVHQDGVALQDA